MKAWMVSTNDWDMGSWLVHAESAGKAKSAAFRHTDLREFDPEFTDLRAARISQLDNKPFTLENAELVLFFPDSVDDDGNPYTGECCTREDYRNQCPCKICKTSIETGVQK